MGIGLHTDAVRHDANFYSFSDLRADLPYLTFDKPFTEDSQSGSPSNRRSFEDRSTGSPASTTGGIFPSKREAIGHKCACIHTRPFLHYFKISATGVWLIWERAFFIFLRIEGKSGCVIETFRDWLASLGLRWFPGHSTLFGNRGGRLVYLGSIIYYFIQNRPAPDNNNWYLLKELSLLFGCGGVSITSDQMLHRGQENMGRCFYQGCNILINLVLGT